MLIAAHVALVLPFVVRSVWVSVRNLDATLERAAASLGATPWRTFRRVTLPLLRPGLFAALLFAVVVSLNEFVVSLFISNRVTEILPVAMYSYVVNYTDPTIAACPRSSSWPPSWSSGSPIATWGWARVPPPPLSAMARAVVELKGCTRDYGGVRAVDALDLVIFEGELLSLLGPVGLRQDHHPQPDRGLRGADGGAHRHRRRGRDGAARPPARARRGLPVLRALPAPVRLRERGLRAARAPDAAGGDRAPGGRGARARAAGPGRGGSGPAELSGGMQQRVALARALVYRPRVLLLDEPLAALDKKLREEMRDELRAIQRSVGITTVFVTHDQAEALGLSDRIAVMSRGRIEQLGAPREIYERPASRFVADFIGASTVLRGRAVAEDRVALSPDLTIRVSVGSLLRVGDQIELAIRPERVRLAAAPGEGTAEARIEALVYQGALTEVTARLADGQRVRVFVSEPAPMPLASGQIIHLRLPADAFMVLA